MTNELNTFTEKQQAILESGTDAERGKLMIQLVENQERATGKTMQGVCYLILNNHMDALCIAIDKCHDGELTTTDGTKMWRKRILDASKFLVTNNQIENQLTVKFKGSKGSKRAYVVVKATKDGVTEKTHTVEEVVDLAVKYELDLVSLLKAVQAQIALSKVAEEAK